MWWHGSNPSVSSAALSDMVPHLGRPAPITWRQSPPPETGFARWGFRKSGRITPSKTLCGILIYRKGKGKMENG